MAGASLAAAVAAATCARGALGQRPGAATPEGRPELLLQSCGAPGSCAEEPGSVTLDAQWRWLHDAELRDCMEKEAWNKDVCKDPAACAEACMLEGIAPEDYGALYGVRSDGRGLELGFVTASDFGRTVGSRLYVMENDDTYKLFQLKNREIAFDVDVSTLPCGLNAALYMVEMDAKGGRSPAGAKFGTGYCDAQCPHGQKFIDGEANLQDWDPARGGHWASCCPEMDLFEANAMSMAFTAHPCSAVGPQRVAGADAGDEATGDHYMGVCDKDGCDFNPYRLGNKDFFGPGGSGVDSKAPFTVVTQFLTSDETDAGELVEIRQFYVQGGRVIESPKPKGLEGVHGNSLTPSFCDAEKEAFKACRKPGQDKGPFNKFRDAGGLRAMGEALARGMVLVFSLWDDPATAMRWLDSAAEDLPDDVPGVLRGPCSRSEGDAAVVEETAAGASARFSNIRYGALGATTPGVETSSRSPPEEAAPPGAGAEGAGEAVGGDAATPELPPHDCGVGDRAAWPPEKQEWCCANAQICPEELPPPPPDQPHDCGHGDRFMWPRRKKEWCCATSQIACPDEVPLHDCGHGDRFKWRREKKEWCCATSQIACPEEVPLHDCGHGDRSKWAREKQEWCCATSQIACPEELAPQPPVRLAADVAANPGSRAAAPLAGGGASAPSGTAGALAAVLAAAVAASAAAAAALRARRPWAAGPVPADALLLRTPQDGERSPEEGGEEALGTASE